MATENKLAFNSQNLPSGRKEGQTKALRTSLHAPDGHSLIGCDSSQYEVRVLAYMCNDTALMQAFADNVCPYSLLAVDMFGEGTPEQIKRDAKNGIEPWAMRRQVAKSARLGAGFQMGAPKFKDYAKISAGLVISDAESKEYIGSFRRSSPELVRFWATCQSVLGYLVQGRTGCFGGADGKLFYYDGMRTVLGVHLPGIRMPDGLWLSYPGLATEPGDYGPSYFYKTKRGKGFEKVYTFGGKLAENLTQCMAFGIMKWYAPQLEYPMVLNSHDEHVILVSDSDVPMAVKHIERVMSSTPPWAPGLLMGCEVKTGKNYGAIK